MAEPIPASLVQMVNEGRYDQASAILARLQRKQPNDGPTNNSYAVVLAKLGKFAQAEFFSRKAVAAAPRDAVNRETLSHILATLEKFGEAIPEYRKAVELDPGNPAYHLGLANMLWDQGQLFESLESMRSAMRIAPGNPGLTAVYVSLLQNVGELKEAERLAREALERFPMDRQLLQVLLLTLNYVPGADPAEVVSLHRRFGAAVLAEVPPHQVRTHPRLRPSGRKLRVGYISPDLRQHSVTYFLEPVLAAHDRANFEVFAYFTAKPADATTARLKQLPITWRDLSGDDEQMAAAVAADNLDVLIELTGLTTANRLGVMARKPARVQATYIGYPNTTGVPQVDFRIVDAVTDPEGTDGFAVERLARLPGCFLCYRPVDGAPDVAPPPSASGEPITFGSFNNSAKLTEPVVRLWTKLLDAVPGSRLVIKSQQFKCEWLRRAYQDRFAAAGAGLERVEVLGPVKDKGGHLGAYQRIDIGLDPFPYNGTTTTCEAMSMGVPIVTLMGRVHAGRVGASLLTAAGVPELIARDEADYVRIAADLARDAARLWELRTTLRERVRTGLCDAARFTRGLETAYAKMISGA